jgi:hypothetical protein
MNDYGIFTNIVGNAGTIIAMAAAIALTWRGRANWEPSEQDIPKAPQKVAGLLSAVIITVIWVSFREPEHASSLTKFSLILSFAAVLFLCLYAFVVSTQTYTQVFAISAKKFDERKIIGGFKLTEASIKAIEDARAQGNPVPTVNDLFKSSGYDPDRVWTRASRALAKVLCILSYIGLIGTGTVALASAAILVDLRKAPSANEKTSYFVSSNSVHHSC